MVNVMRSPHLGFDERCVGRRKHPARYNLLQGVARRIIAPVKCGARVHLGFHDTRTYVGSSFKQLLAKDRFAGRNRLHHILLVIFAGPSPNDGLHRFLSDELKSEEYIAALSRWRPYMTCCQPNDISLRRLVCTSPRRMTFSQEAKRSFPGSARLAPAKSRSTLILTFGARGRSKRFTSPGRLRVRMPFTAFRKVE